MIMPPHLQRFALLAVSTVMVLLLVTEAIRRESIEPHAGLVPSFMSLRRHQLFLGPGSGSAHNPDGKVCPTCNCSEIGSFSSSPWAGNLPTLEHLWSRHATKADFARYLSHHILLSAQAEPLPVPDTSRMSLLQNFITCPDKLFSFSFDGLRMGLPTSYIFTRTGGKGRLGAAEKRLRYFRRHADTIREFHELAEKEGYYDGAKGEDKQLLWLIIEDDDHISPEIAQWLSTTGLRKYMASVDGSERKTDIDKYTISIHIRSTWSYKVCLESADSKQIAYLADSLELDGTA